MDTQRTLYVYSNAQGHYTIAREALGEFLFQVARPSTIKEVLWWVRAKGEVYRGKSTSTFRGNVLIRSRFS